MCLKLEIVQKLKKIEATPKHSDDTELTIKEFMDKEECWSKPIKSSIGYFNMKNIKKIKNKNDFQKSLAIIKEDSPIDHASSDGDRNLFDNGLCKDFAMYFKI